MSSATLTHPADRAVHAVNNALQIAFALRDSGHAEDASRIVQLLADVPADIAALATLNRSLEEDLQGLRDQGIADAREITSLRTVLGERNDRLALASRQVEQLLQSVSINQQRQTTDFNAVRTLRDTLDPSAAARPHSVTTTEAPRSIAAGA
jgi:hypothetical protein